jgi:hypothetical protein
MMRKRRIYTHGVAPATFEIKGAFIPTVREFFHLIDTQIREWISITTKALNLRDFVADSTKVVAVSIAPYGKRACVTVKFVEMRGEQVTVLSRSIDTDMLLTDERSFATLLSQPMSATLSHILTYARGVHTVAHTPYMQILSTLLIEKGTVLYPKWCSVANTLCYVYVDQPIMSLAL